MSIVGIRYVESTPTPPRVLVVEDDVLVRMLLADALRAAGYDVIEAANADEALDLVAAARPPDVLVTDVDMPGDLDGLALAARVRDLEPGLKVVIASGSANCGAATLADAFFAKPYDLGVVLGAIRTLTER